MKRKRYSPEAEKQMLALEAFGSDSFLSVNKRLLSHFGPSVTIFLCNLIDKYKYFKERGYLNEDGSFFLRHADQAEQTGMNEYELRKCKKKLVEDGVISTEMRGIPRREYYYIHLDVLVQEFLRTIPLNFKGQDPKNLKGNTSKNLRTIKETEYKETERKDIDSKESYGPSDHQDEYIPSEDTIHIMDYWSNLSNKTVKHKPSSKTYKQACSMIDRLLEGLPIFPKPTQKDQPHKNLLNFCTKHNLSIDILHKQWKRPEIQNILELVEQELPDDQKYSLESILWNNFAKGGGFSSFLYKADQKQTPETYVSMADKLAVAIGTHLSEAKRIDWAKNFQIMHNENGKTKEQIYEVLDWYMQNYDYSKVRSVENAQEFCDYFNKIRKSMQIKEDRTSNSPKLRQAVRKSADKYYPC